MRCERGYFTKLSAMACLIAAWLFAGNASGAAAVPSDVAAQVGAGLDPAAGLPAMGHPAAVAVLSARDVWAVGEITSACCMRPMTARWNGSRWTRVPIPPVSGIAALEAVTAISPGSVWAVGWSQPAGSDQTLTLILHWNGRTWKKVPSPSPGGQASLYGVAATSARSAWAVGENDSGPVCDPLILRWNGRAWKQSPVPHLPDGGSVSKVAAVSATRAWAVGYTPTGNDDPLILTWNGRAWHQTPTPRPAAGSILDGVAALSASSAWAVGSTNTLSPEDLILRWNGTTWKRVPGPAEDSFNAVAVVSARAAWAVGITGTRTFTPVIARWNGVTWKSVPGPAKGVLIGVAARSPRDAWAVGVNGSGGSLAIHWNGARWKAT
jgi:hypothetical protein